MPTAKPKAKRRSRKPAGVPAEAPPLRLEYRSPAELAENPKNWRRHPASQLGALAGALQEVGWAGACLFNEATGRLIDGHARRKVAIEQGAATVPVLVGSWTPEQEAKILATLDPVGGMATADPVALDALLREVNTGCAELQKMLDDLWQETQDAALANAAEAAGDVEEDTPPETQAAVVTRPGDVWVMGRHRLLCGDSRKAEDVQRVMGGERWRLMVTSPPYNQGLDKFKPSGMHTETHWVRNVQTGSYFDSKEEGEYQSEQVAAIAVWVQFCAADASLFYNHKNRYRDKAVVSPWKWLEKTGLKVRQEIIWKREGSVTQNARMFLPCDERVYWLYPGDDFYFDDSTEHKTWSSVWSINSHKDLEESQHGCAFPMELVTRPMRACSETGDAVADFYLGSGTTLIAAEALGRRCFGIEIAPQYCDVAVRRWQSKTNQHATRESDGAKFNDMEPRDPA